MGRKLATAVDTQPLLLRLRLQHGWSQKDVMEKTGLSYNTVAFAERGTVLSKKTAEILSKLYGVEIVSIPTVRRPRRPTRNNLQSIGVEQSVAAVEAAVEELKSEIEHAGSENNANPDS